MTSPSDTSGTRALLADLRAIVGAAGCVDEPGELAPFLREWRGRYRSVAVAAVMPRTTTEAALVVRACAARGVVMIPQGGNTGLVGGAVAAADERRPQVILSARRLDRIRGLDRDNYTIIAEAGCPLARLQAAAAEAGRFFPLSLAAEGSCQIGGNVSTNAGGINVLRYGTTRELVLGVEVVLPDGRVLDCLRGLRKDNTGYDLKQLFIGAEGTLGFVTAAVCRLFQEPRGIATAFVALATPADAVRLLGEARRQLGDDLIAFELMDRRSVALTAAGIPRVRDPFADAHPWYVLIEVASVRAAADVEAELTNLLHHCSGSGAIRDGVLARSGAQRDDFWRLRHHIPEAQRLHGASIKHDISVPVSAVPAFLARAGDRARALVPGVEIVAFGHLGDGNLHFNLGQPPAADSSAFLARWEAVARAIHEVAMDLGGSFSAEHGVGLLKAGELQRLRSPVELDLMRRIKTALDPDNLMNPGKILG